MLVSAVLLTVLFKLCYVLCCQF